jgi:hypothetical protein
MHALTSPVVYNSKLDQRHRELLHHDVLKNTHQRQFIADFQTHVIAEEGVEEFKL